MGYKYIETYSHPEGRDEKTFGFGLPVKEAKARLDDLGLQVVGAHFYPEHPEGLDEYCAYYAELGATQVGCGGIYEDEMAHKAEALNAAGRIAKKHGLRYYYHNHYHEYRKVNGEYIMHIFAKETRPSSSPLSWTPSGWFGRASIPWKKSNTLGIPYSAPSKGLCQGYEGTQGTLRGGIAGS